MTDKQLQTLWVIRAFVGYHGYAPTFTELARILKVSTTGAVVRLRQLRRKGKVIWVTDRARSLRIVNDTEASIPVLSLPDECWP